MNEMISDDMPEDQVAEKKFTSKNRRDREIEELRVLLSVRGNRDFIWRLFAKTRLFKSSYTGNSHDAAHMEGQRAVGLWTLAELNEADPQAFIKMQIENKDK